MTHLNWKLNFTLIAISVLGSTDFAGASGQSNFGSNESIAAIDCQLENGVHYSLTKSKDGAAYALSISRLDVTHSSAERGLLTGLGVPEAQIPRGSVRVELSFPVGKSCVFSSVAKDPFFTCEYQAADAPITVRFYDLFDKEFAQGQVGSLIIEQHSSVVRAMRKRASGDAYEVSWPAYPVLFYFKRFGAEGGPALGSTWSNGGFTSDNAGHGRCTMD